MKYFKPAIITLVIAILAVLGLLFYISIINGDNKAKGQSGGKSDIKTSVVGTTVEVQTETVAQTSAVTSAQITSAAVTSAALSTEISANGVTYPQHTLDTPIKAIVTGDQLRIRSTPSTDGEILGLLYTNTEVMEYGYTEGWAYIKYRDITGWVSSQYLKVE